MSRFLLLLVLGFIGTLSSFADCQGCCSSGHGGVVCVGNVTQCGDGTPLSEKCRNKGCNKCTSSGSGGSGGTGAGGSGGGGGTTTTRIPLPPIFVVNDHFFWDSDGNLVILLPDPNSDGYDVAGTGSWSYLISVLSECQMIDGLDAMSVDFPQWPQTITLQGDSLPSDFTIEIARVNETGAISESISVRPLKQDGVVSEESSHNLKRWLLHVPKEAGGFSSQLRLTNRNPNAVNLVALTAFDATGTLLAQSNQTVFPGSTSYIEMYGDRGVFGEYLDRVSHIGISDSEGFSEVSLQYRSLSSGYSAWIEEIDLADGELAHNAFILEARTDEQSADGVAILNLTANTLVQVYARQRTRNNTLLNEERLPSIEPGGKVLSVLSSLFPFKEEAVYTIETLDPDHRIQVMGFSFSGGDFFSPLQVRKMK